GEDRAHAPLEKGDAVRGQLAELAANPLVKSVRRLIQSEGVDFPLQPDFVRGVKLVAEHGLRFDLCIFHPQLANTVRLVEQCPEVSFVLDHIGKPDIKNGLMEPWREEIVALASLPNVYCKLSGMVTEADHQRWTPDDLKPYIDHVVAAFGKERIMYGGDWPVSTQAATYRRWLETLDWATADFSPADKHKLFYQNAVDFYGLPS
ncbi:MAG: amidohydrolase family protein, partial [Caldilineaceae bacterium]|nr:amidohydrolase family protein [Caldilineaceae bacterium]